MIDEQTGDEFMGLSWVFHYLERAHKAALYLSGEGEFYE
jgi:hypothetical protein